MRRGGYRSVPRGTAGRGGEACKCSSTAGGREGQGLECDGLTEQRAAMRGLLPATGFLLRVVAVLEVWTRLCASTAATATCNAGAGMLQESQPALWATTCGPLDSATFARGPRRLDASNLSGSSVRRGGWQAGRSRPSARCSHLPRTPAAVSASFPLAAILLDPR